jgi:hypothetical protein
VLKLNKAFTGGEHLLIEQFQMQRDAGADDQRSLRA